MTWAEVLLPGSLLLFKTAVKVFVDKSPTAADGVGALIVLPIDTVFLATSLFAAYALLASGGARTEALAYFVLCLVFTLLIGFVSRRNDHFFVQDRWVLTGLVLIANFALSIAALYVAIELLGSLRK